MLKKCNKCNQLKLDMYDFNIIWNSKRECYYYYSMCKQCESIKGRTYYFNNHEKAKKRINDYRYSHLKEEKVRQIKYRLANRKQLLLYAKQYYNRHKTERKQYRDKHKDQHKVVAKDHYNNNKAYYIEKNRKRKMHLSAQFKSLSINDQHKANLIYKMCDYLNKNLNKPAWHVDHKTPLSKGGLHHPDNLWIIPAKDNLLKNNNGDYELDHNFYFKL